MKSKKEKTIEEEYQKLDPRVHILIRPDTYVGSVQPANMFAWVVDENYKASKAYVEFVPAFVKCFDEILTNASDHSQRDGSGVTRLDINFNASEGWISVRNDGKGIPVKKHKDAGVILPEMIFGHLLSGSNFNDSEERFGAGRNGYGAKLTNVFSKRFEVSTADGSKSYKGVWIDNMTNLVESKTGVSKQSYTEIKFYPDSKLFNLDSVFTPHHINLIRRRCVDVAGYTGVDVYLNGEKIPVNDFKTWVELFVSEEQRNNIIYDKLDKYWSLAVVATDEDIFEQFSIVNGNTTYAGGTHISYFEKQIINSVQEHLQKKHKDIPIRPNDIRSKLNMFLVSKIPNPQFSTQTKEFCTTSSTSFASQPTVSPKFIKSILDSDILSRVKELIEQREVKELKKLTKSTYKLKIEKLEDAIKAGTKESSKCSLVLCEGDSARSTAISGLSVVGRDYYGVYPLRGKFVNVREASLKKLKESEQVSNLLTILGLEFGKKYHTQQEIDELRYGRIILMTDADTDGTHIKCLILNFFHFFFPELLKTGYILDLTTPIVKAKKGNSENVFKSLDEFRKWSSTVDISSWRVKYYKGLGSSTSEEAKSYFKNLDDNLVVLKYTDSDSDIIDMAFNKYRVEDRKNWIMQCDSFREDLT